MKPIEIHIEGYKIVISEDDEKKGYEKVIEKVQPVTIPNTSEPLQYPNLPYTPQGNDWWRYPYVTWTNDDSLSNIKTTSTSFHPVGDAMVNTGGIVSTNEVHIIGDNYPEEEHIIPPDKADEIKQHLKDAIERELKPKAE